MEDWGSIAADVADAIASVGFSATITPAATDGPTTPWGIESGTPQAPVAVTVIDDGIRDIYAPGGLILRKARVLTIGAVGFTPAMSDVITLHGSDYVVGAVNALAPGGADLMFEIEIAA